MAHAYTPGLRVTRDAVLRRTRRLPMQGKVLGQVGDIVQRQQVVARTDLPGNVRTMNVIRNHPVPASVPITCAIAPATTIIPAWEIELASSATSE